MYIKSIYCLGHSASAGGLSRGKKFLLASSGNLLFQLLPTVTHPVATCCCKKPVSVFSTTPLSISVAPDEFAPVNEHGSCAGSPKTRSRILMRSERCGSCRQLPAGTHAGTRCVSLCPHPAPHRGSGLEISQEAWCFTGFGGLWLKEGRSCPWAGLGTKT